MVELFLTRNNGLTTAICSIGYYNSRRICTQNSFQCPSSGSQLQDAASTSAPFYQNTLQLVQEETSKLQETPRTLSESAESMKSRTEGNSSDEPGAYEEYDNYGYDSGGETPTFPGYFYSPVFNVDTSPPLVIPSQSIPFDPVGRFQSPAYTEKPLQFSLKYDWQLPDFNAGPLMMDSSPESMEYLVSGYTEWKPESSFPTDTMYCQAPKKTCSLTGCNKNFLRQEDIIRHEKTHSNERQHQCEFCPKQFGRYDNFKSHVKRHAFPNTGNRTEFCEGLRKYMRTCAERPRMSKGQGRGRGCVSYCES